MSARTSARLLSNGTLVSLVSAEGSDFTQLGERQITSWTPDPLGDPGGVLFYLRDAEDGAFWSLGLEPVSGAPERYEARRGRAGSRSSATSAASRPAARSASPRTAPSRCGGNSGGCSAAVVGVLVDGRALAPREGAAVWEIVDDGAEHAVEVELGARAG